MTRGALLAVGCIVAGILACTTSGVPDTPTPMASERLSDVQVDRMDGASVVTFVGLYEAGFSVRRQDDPWALIVELPSIELEGPIASKAVYDGMVDQVSVSGFVAEDGTPTTRVEIALSEEPAHEIRPGMGGIALHITSVSEDGESFGMQDDPWAEGEGSELATEPADVPDAPAATTLSSVSVDSSVGGVLMHLVADGMIAVTESFTLEGPDRLVIDLPGITSGVEKGQIAVASPEVAQVRVGAHADKVRVVVDGGEMAAGFEGRRMMPVPDGMLVTVGTGESVDAAMAAAVEASEATWIAANADSVVATEVASVSETEDSAWSVDDGDEMEIDSAVAEMEEMVAVDAVEEMDSDSSDTWIDAADTLPAAPAADASDWIAESEDTIGEDTVAATTDSIQIYGVHYAADAEHGRERVAVLADGTMDVVLLEPDSQTLVVSIRNAVIADEATGRIAPESGGPLQLVTAFQQPEVEPQEVRVVLTRSAGVQPAVSRHGTTLFLDFPSDTLGTAAQVADDPAPLAMGGETAGEELPMAEATGADAMDEMAAVDPMIDPTEPQMPTEAVVAPEGTDFEAVSEVPVAEPTPPAAIASEPVQPPASLEPPAAIDILEEGGLIDGKEYKGRRISLDFKDVAIADVLRLIAEVSDLNIISGDETDGEVTIRLVDVPWDQALDVILLTKGLGFVRVGNVLRIAPADILAQEEEVRLQERRAKEKLEDLVVKLIPVNYADVKEMQNLVKRLLTPRGTVNIDERTSTLIIKDIASVLDEASALVKAVDTETPQVMIEAKIVEASLDFARELGAVWTVGAQQRIDAFDPGSGPRRDQGNDAFRLGPSAFRDLNQSNSLSVLNSLTAQPTALFNLSAFLLDEQINVDVQLQAAENTGNGKVVSSPRVVTLDNTEAEVAQGVSIPFQTFENGDAKLEFVDAVLSLKVTPHITADESIIMQIEVTRDAADSSFQTATGSPAIAKNQAKTVTLVKNSQTLVLGGIYTIDKSYRSSRVPYLHRIPIIGVAFRSKEVRDQRKELLIFVTPRIVIQPDDA